MRNIITYDGVQLSTFDLYNNGRGTYNSPTKSYDVIKIKGRSGDLLYDNKRFENIELTYPECFISRDFDNNIKALKAFLLSKSGYKRLEDTYNPTEFRMAVCKNAIDINYDVFNRVGSFDLVFLCKPQRFLKTGEQSTTMTQSGTINNPTLFDSKPLIRVYGTGVLGIGSQSITITEADVYTDIDCEMMDAYKGSVNKNSCIQLSNYDFPVLKAGSNNINLGNGITQIDIVPRWWTI